MYNKSIARVIQIGIYNTDIFRRQKQIEVQSLTFTLYFTISKKTKKMFNEKC